MKFIKKLLLLLLLIVIVIYLIPTSPSDFFKSYPNNDKISQNLKEFQSRTINKINVDGTEWEYYSGGSGSKTILFLHGMGGSYDLWWQQVNAFEEDYKVITYTLPKEVNSLEKASKGILKILEKEGIDKFYAVGTSMGGYIAQYLVKTIPSRIEKVVFGNTFPPNDLILKENVTKSKIIPLLPEILFSKLGEKKLNNEIIPAAKNSELLKAFLPSLPSSKKLFMNRYSVVIDRFTATPNKYEIKRIPKLIIESDNDPLIQPELRKEIKELYTNAEVFTFHNEGHFPYINAADEYNNVLKDFFNKENLYEDIELTIQKYFEGRKNADLNQLKTAFSNNAKLYTVVDNKELIIPFEDYLNKVKSDGKQNINTQILFGDITENIATFKTEFDYSDKTYIDYLTLLNTQYGWKIMAKTFIKTD